MKLTNLSKKYKILHVIQMMHSGGVEQRKLLLAQNLPKQKFEQKIICTYANPMLKEKFEKAGCEVFEIGDLKHPFDIKAHIKAIKIIRKYKPHIIHGSVFEGNTIAGLTGFIMRVPIRILEETSYPIKRKPRANKFFKLLAKLSHQVIAISDEVKTYLVQQAGVPHKKIKVIYNGVKNPEKLSSIDKIALKKDLKIPLDNYVIGSIGRMEDDVKGFDILLQFFQTTLGRFPNLTLIIVGDGKLLNEYKFLANKLNILSSVRFVGYKTNVNDYYEIMDIYATLPRSEGFGLSIVEAMSHKIPVIATNIGGIKNIIQHGETGYLLKDYNLEDFEVFIDLLLTHPSSHAYIVKNSFIQYKNKFTEHIYCDNTNTNYVSLMEKI